MTYNRWNVCVYLVLKWLIEKHPGLGFNPWVKLALANCFADWVLWKTKNTMASVDKQVEELHKHWDKEELQTILHTAQTLYPDAKVSLHGESGAVLIQHPPDGSEAQELLGGAMEIKAPWTLGE